MRNGAFVTWLLGWWIANDISEYSYFLTHGKHFIPTDGYAWFFIGLWIFIGILLYEKKEDEEV